MKTLLTTLIAFVLLVPMATAQTNGRIKVTVLDENRLPVPGAIVQITAGGPTMGGATDLDGNFTFVNLNPGTYDVKSVLTGYKEYTKSGVQVAAGQTAYITYNMVVKTDTLPVKEVVASRSPVDPTFSTIQSINADQIKTAAGPRGDVGQMITGYSSQVSIGAGGQMVMRGSREGASAIYIDGEKTYGSYNVPALGIGQVTVLSGGIPAEYGDLSGGAVIITTHSFYTGMAAQERMYQAAAEKEAADSAAVQEAAGKRVENNSEVIEIQDQPQGEQQPAPAPDPVPADQPKEEEQPK